MNPRVDGPHMSPEDRTSSRSTRATGAGAAKRAPAPILSEAALHKAVAKYLHAVLAPEVIWTTIGHGGGGRIRGGQLKAMGLRKGVPDLLLCWWCGSAEIGWIELKSKKGRTSPEQQEFLLKARDLGHNTAIVRDLSFLEETLKFWRVPTRIAA